MLRMNLSTRPFYNERGVRCLFLVLGLLGTSLLFGGVARVFELATAQSELGLSADIVERETKEIEAKITEIDGHVGDAALEPLIDAVEKVNQLISQRVFSWSEFFSLIEKTLPDEVIVTGLRPKHDNEGTNITINVVGTSVTDIDEFIRRLEETSSFFGVLAHEEEMTGDRRYRALLRGRYLSRNESIVGDELSIDP